MKHRVLPLFIAAMVATAPLVRAQLVTDTLTGYDANDSLAQGGLLPSGTALTQIFETTDSLGIQDVSFRFLSTVNTSAATSLTVYVSQWSGSAPTGGLLAEGLLNLDAGASWTFAGPSTYFFDATINLGDLTLASGNLYAISIVGNADTASGGIVLGAGSSDYLGGSGFTNSGPVTTFADLSTGNSAYTGIVGDFAFASSIGSSGAAITPVPEAGAAAVAFAAMFIAASALRRRPRATVLAA